MGLFLWTWAVSLNKSIWAADFPFVLLSSCPMVTHSAWLSRNIQSALSLPISRCNKTQQLLLWGTLKGILWGRWESRAEWQPMPQPIFTFSCLRRGWEGGDTGTEEERERAREGGLLCMELPFLVIVWLSPPIVKCLLPQVSDWNNINCEKCIRKMSHKCIVLVNEAWTATSQGSPRLNNTQCTQNRSHNSNWCGWHFPILLEHICTVTWSCVRQLWLILSFCKWKFSRHKFMWVPVLSLQSTCYYTGPCRFFSHRYPKSLEMTSGRWRYWSRHWWWVS